MSRYITGGASGSSAGGSVGGGGTARQERFITSGTFNVPSGVTSAEVLVVAGGGGGARGYGWQTSNGGGGGQGGQVKLEVVNLTGISSCSIVVGAGGGYVNTSSSDAYNSWMGGQSSFTYGSNAIVCQGGRQGSNGGVNGAGGPHWYATAAQNSTQSGYSYGAYSQSFHNSTGGHTRGAGGHGRCNSGNFQGATMDGMPGMYGFGGGGGGGAYTNSAEYAYGGKGSDGGGIASTYDWWQGWAGTDNTSYAYFRHAEKNTGGGGAGGSYDNNEYGGNGADGIVIVTYSV